MSVRRTIVVCPRVFNYLDIAHVIWRKQYPHHGLAVMRVVWPGWSTVVGDRSDVLVHAEVWASSFSMRSHAGGGFRTMRFPLRSVPWALMLCAVDPRSLRPPLTYSDAFRDAAENDGTPIQPLRRNVKKATPSLIFTTPFVSRLEQS